MSAVRAIAAEPETSSLRMTLLGTGTVGSAFVERLAALQGGPLRIPPLVAIANSRGFVRVNADTQRAILGELREIDNARDGAWMSGDSFGRGDVVVDATASALVADRHAEWLRRGAHVVTACKIGQGSDLAHWSLIQRARNDGGTRYGDSATVGAGLPLLRSIRMLKRGGDRIHAIAGVLSGSLAWLFNHYDGMRPFSGFVRDARDAGYTEPDPRDDLSGEDVRRKILILARAADVELESVDVDVQSLVPAALAALPTSEVNAALPEMDEPLRQRFAEAHRNGEVLKFIARLENGRARVGLESLPSDHPLAGGTGTDNRVAIWSDRYNVQPLVVQGPGAGAEVTAAALLDDVLEISTR